MFNLNEENAKLGRYDETIRQLTADVHTKQDALEKLRKERDELDLDLAMKQAILNMFNAIRDRRQAEVELEEMQAMSVAREDANGHSRDIALQRKKVEQLAATEDEKRRLVVERVDPDIKRDVENGVLQYEDDSA